MASESPLPDDIPEVASIRISVGLEESGTGTGYAVEGMSSEAAIGYLTTIADKLRAQVANSWEDAQSDKEFDVELHALCIECPSCGEEITIDPSDVFGEEDEE